MRQLLTDLRGNPIYSFAQRRLRRMRHFHPSTLICLIQNRSWEEVIRRARKHPSEALHQDELTGNTPLHIACRLDPPPAVILALRAASRISNHEGATPLHIAASHRCSAQSMQVLLECAKQHKQLDRKDVSPTADLSRMGRAPIHYACMSFRGLDIDAFRLLFEESIKEGNLVMGPENHCALGENFDDEEDFPDDIYSSSFPGTHLEVNVLGIKDATGQTPLALLFRRYRERVKVVIGRVDRLHREHQDIPEKAALAAAMTVHANLGDLWKRAGWIIARLTEERLKRESSHFRGIQEECCRSPGEVAVAREAASWATECIATVNPRTSTFRKSIRASFPSLEAKQEDKNSDAKFGRLQFRIVHASVGLTGYGCPPEIIRLALSLHPHQVREMDEEGNLPIHIAATSSSFLTRTNDTHPNFVAAAAAMAVPVDASADDLSVLSEAMSFFSSATVSQTTNPFDKVIKLLLERFPEGACTPHGKSGMLPLVLALRTGVRTFDDGLRTLINAHPPALHSEKIIQPAVYPHLLALLANERNTNLDNEPGSHHITSSRILRREEWARTTLYALLRAKPDLLSIANDDQ